MNKKSFLIVPFFFVNMANAALFDKQRAMMHKSKMAAEEIGSFQKADCIKKQEFMFLCWKRGLKKSGSSVEIVKEHFPEIYPIIETVLESYTIEYNDYQTLMNFVDETKELLQEEEENNRFQFPPKSKEQSRVFLCNLICGSAIVFFITDKMRRENLNADFEEQEKAIKKTEECIRGIGKGVVKIAGVTVIIVIAGVAVYEFINR